jgi:hypothetical protein
MEGSLGAGGPWEFGVLWSSCLEEQMLGRYGVLRNGSQRSAGPSKCQSWRARAFWRTLGAGSIGMMNSGAVALRVWALGSGSRRSASHGKYGPLKVRVLGAVAFGSEVP